MKIRVIRGKNNSRNSCQFVAKNMTDIAIRVENLSKQYRIGGPQARYKTIRESLTQAVAAFKGRFLGHDRDLSRDGRNLQFGHRGW